MTRSPSDALARVRDYPSRKEHLVVGLMSGTSADAVDVALVRFKGAGPSTTQELLHYCEKPMSELLRKEVLDVAACEELSLERLMRLDATLGESFAAATLEALTESGLDPKEVDAIGSHGQTVRHVPRHSTQGAALTLQIGSAAILAERTGIAVVSDFRRRDTAAGGEGAPLVPLADWWLFRSDRESRALLNLGGMANVTYLPRGKDADAVIAFDTGPGNAVLDALATLITGGMYHRDEGGAAARRGRASEALLTELLADPFFAIPPPRSTGREHFGERYAGKLLEVGLSMGLSQDDVLATAVELTASSVASALDTFLTPRGGLDTVIVSGGGVHNASLMAALERRLAPKAVVPLMALGVPPEAKEALAFAFLAHQTLNGLPGNLPSATGASHPVVLGHITPANVL